MSIYLIPWIFSPVFVVSWLFVAALYAWLLIRKPSVVKKRYSLWRVLCFYLGWLSVYLVWHTYFDYLSQYMFWVHRLQHLVLHHISPLLLVMGLSGYTANMQPSLLVVWRFIPSIIHWPCGLFYSIVQHPVVAPLLFVGLIYFWLWPGIHFSAMLNQNLYYVMNASMLLDGFLFWWLILGPAWRGEPDGFRVRIIMLMVVLVPQQLLGAYLSLSGSVVYDVYEVCGRAWPINPLSDQVYGGIITWVPASMMSVVGFLLVLRRRLNYQQV